MKSPRSEKERLDKVTVAAITGVARGIEAKIEKRGTIGKKRKSAKC